MAPVGDKTGFFAVDSTVKDRVKTAVLGDDLATELKAAKGQKILFLMDVSFKGFDAGKETLVEPTLRDLLGAIFGTSEDRDEEPNVTDKLVILSTIPSHDPLTKGDHGLLAATTMAALQGKADVEGYEPDGLVTADELTSYLDKEAANEARAIGKTTKEKETVPFIVGEETSHFAITKNPAVTATVTKRLAALKELGKAEKISKEAFEEGTVLLNRMPKLKAQQELRKAYEKLADGTDGEQAVSKFIEVSSKLKESMKLPAKDAAEFADNTYKGIEQVRAKYIKVLNAGEMTANAIHGMYRRLELPVPQEFEADLKKAKDMDAAQSKELLARPHEARRPRRPRRREGRGHGAVGDDRGNQ